MEKKQQADRGGEQECGCNSHTGRDSGDKGLQVRDCSNAALERDSLLIISPPHKQKQTHSRFINRYKLAGKNSWPQLPGAIGKKAEKLIGNENKTVDAIIVRGGSSVPEDFRCDRVWLWVNHCDIVTRVPVVG